MKLKRISYLFGMLTLFTINASAFAKPLLQCVEDTNSLGWNNLGIDTYVFERDTETGNVFGRWHIIHDYDQRPHSNYSELYPDSNTIVRKIILLKDIEDEGILTDDRINLRSIYSITGNAVNKNESQSAFSLKRVKLADTKAIEFTDSKNKKTYFYPWTLSGLDKDGNSVKALDLYCTPTDNIDKKSYGSSIAGSQINTIEIPDKLHGMLGYKDIHSLLRQKDLNIATFRLSYKKSILSKAKNSPLMILKWRIVGNALYQYKVQYQLFNRRGQVFNIKSQKFVDSTPGAPAKDVEVLTNKYSYPDGNGSYYQFSIPFSDTENIGKLPNTTKNSDLTRSYYISVQAGVGINNAKIYYTKQIGPTTEATSIKVVDDDYYITHSTPPNVDDAKQPPPSEQASSSGGQLARPETKEEAAMGVDNGKTAVKPVEGNLD